MKRDLTLMTLCCALAWNAPIALGLPTVPPGYSVEVFARNLNGPTSFDIDPNGNLIVCTWEGGNVYSIDPNGLRTPLASGLTRAFEPAVARDGRVFVTVGGSNETAKIWEIVSGEPALFYTGQGAVGIEWNDDGFLYFTQPPTRSVLRTDLDGNTWEFASGLGRGITGLVFGPDGYLYVANRDNGTIYRIGPDGEVEPYLKELRAPEMLAFDRDGALYFAAFEFSEIYKVDSERNVSLFARDDDGTSIRGIGFDANGHLFAIEHHHGVIYRITPPARFLRGDCDGSGRLEGGIVDAVASFRHCFSDREVPCRAACDADGDGDPCSGVTDGLRILQYLFQGTLPLPAPFPGCGVSSRAEDAEIGCETPPNCD